MSREQQVKDLLSDIEELGIDISEQLGQRLLTESGNCRPNRDVTAYNEALEDSSDDEEPDDDEESGEKCAQIDENRDRETDGEIDEDDEMDEDDAMNEYIVLEDNTSDEDFTGFMSYQQPSDITTNTTCTTDPAAYDPFTPGINTTKQAANQTKLEDDEIFYSASIEETENEAELCTATPGSSSAPSIAPLTAGKELE